MRITGPKVFIDHAKGARLVDIDGNEYIDYLLGQGPNFLGHAPDPVLKAVAEASERGMIYGSQHELEIEAGEKVLKAVGVSAFVSVSRAPKPCRQPSVWLVPSRGVRSSFALPGSITVGWTTSLLESMRRATPRL